ncbi:Nse1 non-SMC component of SMC5-6 complex-domain-containing protein [Lineolata rhizophorae]|uniref:Non-structural maintenance of chromosomes element 1 homolog n=1 Tax=Lineolata rhizophorae TaxID=578093 RepID=A0A6A6P1Y6_9PEZI|nr:Nse1 non-SMC component of SMC5-6 complex-domain-containing protein [Lineolata rhizophorae]
MSEEPDEAYDTTHRAFLQAFLARPAMTFEDAKPILARIFSIKEERSFLVNDVTEADFRNYVGTLNAALGPLDYEVRSALPQHGGRARVYALVNTTSDALTQLATAHSADEIAFIKRVLDAMFETHNRERAEIMAVRAMDAVQLHRPPLQGGGGGGGGATQRSSVPADESQAGLEGGQSQSVKAITMKQAEDLLASLKEEGWLERSRRGYYSLSPRALMELRNWLVDTYNDPPDEGNPNQWQRIKMCEACREIVTVGQRCSKRRCNCRLHNICVENFFRTQTERKCPVCKEDWTGRNFVGEKADPRVNNRSSGTSNSRRTPRTNNGDDATMLVEDDE